jgi:hypothetical protein
MEALTANNAYIIELASAATLMLWLTLVIVLRGLVFDMDTSGARYSFHAILAIYRQFYGIIFVFGTILASISDHNASWCRLDFALSSIYALFFVLWTAWQYEAYQHGRYRERDGRSTYTGWKYAVTLTLGIMSPVLFAVGLLGLIIYGQ